MNQKECFDFLIDRGHVDALDNIGVETAEQISEEKLKKLIERYVTYAKANNTADPMEIFDLGYDMGYAMSLIGGSV